MSAIDQNTAPTDNMSKYTVEEIKIPVPWGHISGNWWGPMDQQPIVALHGWQDNAGTYDRLIQHLPPDIAILCVDIPGHGLSSHFYEGQFYYIYWESLLSLRRIIKYYKWKKVKLLGHSLGGAVSFLYAASYPDEVEFVIAVDIVGPTAGNMMKRIPETGSIVDKFLEYEMLKSETVPTYKYEEVLDIVDSAYNGSVCKEGIVTLMKRGILPSYERDQYYFSRDPRLKVSVLGLLSMDVILAYAAQIKCAYLNIRATKGNFSNEVDSYKEILDVIKKGAKRFEYHEVEGTHYVHLNNPERIAPIIMKFIST